MHDSFHNSLVYCSQVCLVMLSFLYAKELGVTTNKSLSSLSSLDIGLLPRVLESLCYPATDRIHWLNLLPHATLTVRSLICPSGLELGAVEHAHIVMPAAWNYSKSSASSRCRGRLKPKDL